MTNLARLLAATAVLGLTAPATAQYYPQPGYQQQTYPQQYPQQTYPQQGYPGSGYNQGYTGNPVTDIIDQLLGNRYNVTDRQAVRRCANSARAQASSQYGGGYGGYGQNGYGQRYNNYGAMQVTAITNVERRSNGLRVSGLMGSGGYGNHGYGNQGYGNQGYGNGGYGAQLSFRCNVDYSGAVTGIRVRPAG